jgi:hypothetical protein
VFLLSIPSEQQLSRDVPVDADFLFDRAPVVEEKTKKKPGISPQLTTGTVEE